MRRFVLIAALVSGCNLGGQQASPVRDVLPKARWVSPDAHAGRDMSARVDVGSKTRAGQVINQGLNGGDITRLVGWCIVLGAGIPLVFMFANRLTKRVFYGQKER